MNKLDHAHQVLASRILDDFIGKITGSGLTRLTGSSPENMLLVGKLMSTRDRDGAQAASSKTFIESIGADFFIAEQDMDRAELTLFPQGDFYYRAVPTLEEQRGALLKELNASTDQYQYSHFDEALAACRAEPARFAHAQVKLLPVYKKISLHATGFSVGVSVRQLLNETKEFGFAAEDHLLNRRLDGYLQELQEQVRLDPEAMTRTVLEPTRVEDLADAAAYQAFLQRSASQKAVSQHQNWRLYFDVSVRKIGGRYAVSVSLVNDSVVLYSGSHRSRSNDKLTVETLFCSGIKIVLQNAAFCPIELEFFSDDYKYEKAQYALGSNCAVEYQREDNALQTNHLPLYRQYRLITNDSLAVRFLDLAARPVETLAEIGGKMRAELARWRAYRAELFPTLTGKGKEKIDGEIAGFEAEIAHFEHGIHVLEKYPIVQKSFIQMNKAFSAASKKYTSWRLFQIVFIVSLLPDIAACDPRLMSEEEKAAANLKSMALLYFPTGGGKTEAFLGALVFNLFFDRHRGKACGVTSILRYPLRLLSVQQVQRLANILAQAELLRRADPAISETACFSLGYFAGDNNTPNRMSAQEYARYRGMSQAQRDEGRIISVCPFCGAQAVHLRADEQSGRLVHYCDRAGCPSGGDLPLYMVDSEIYRFLPSAVISTVDKLAIMGCNASFRNLLNGAELQCPLHGYTSKRRCAEPSCRVDPQQYRHIDMYDPAPTLLIQDELHLIRESLGTYASHYESFLRYYIRHCSKSRRDVKVIGATATISSYQEQVYHLYGRTPIRFPCESPYVDRNFYASVDKTDLQRQILGYAPYGRAIVNSVVYSMKYMREAVYAYLAEPERVLAIPDIGISRVEEALQILEDYWIFLEYNNVKRDGNNVEGALETPVNVELAGAGVPPFQTRKMTGDESFQEVREVLADVENSQNVFDGVNLIAATSMISHGVDADRFNVMFFYGIPGNMAEYIQAYSRTGRRYSSIVVDLIRPTRETDQSYLKNFRSVHQYKDLLVEPVPINRWAAKAVLCTLPGILTSLLLHCYDPELQHTAGSLFFMKNLAKAIKTGSISPERVKEQLFMAYGCVEDSGAARALGNQYREKIEAFVDDVFVQIADKGWGDENLFDGFRLMGCRIMNSLRDTDAQLLIELN